MSRYFIGERLSSLWTPALRSRRRHPPAPRQVRSGNLLQTRIQLPRPRCRRDTFCRGLRLVQMEFHISRAVREAAQVDDLLFGYSGNVVFANVAASRKLADRKSTRLNSSHLGISYAAF